ncbi:MAG: carboxymuconolactone decarboxylase family protein [Parabacteroides sp.]|nr:carboxymuconolactone decarboxylase family protein [Parabacteroides sp.]
MNNETTFQQIFPQGEKNTAYAQYFTGQSYLAPLTQLKELNVPVSNVTFEPGCRNNWHSHTGGQLLIVTAGRGYYQEKGEPARELLPGDVVEIAPDVVHWHGAAPDSWFAHLAVACNPQTNQTTWLGPVDDREYAEVTAKPAPSVRLTDAARRNLDAWFPGYVSTARQTDPELVEVFGNFAFDEVLQYGDLDRKTRMLVTMSSCIALHAVQEYRMMLRAAFGNGITPVEIKEVLYHAVPYAGIAKVADFIGITNEFLTANGVRLPLESQSGTSPETRYGKGLALQKEIFGEQIDRMYEAAPENQKHLQCYLSANCFGDYQTRTGLDTRQRELLTFSILVSLGGCESQVKGHITGNVAVGNDKNTLLAVVTQLLPYIGYPRTLNAIACLNEMIPQNE